MYILNQPLSRSNSRNFSHLLYVVNGGGGGSNEIKETPNVTKKDIFWKRAVLREMYEYSFTTAYFKIIDFTHRHQNLCRTTFAKYSKNGDILRI